MNNEERKIISKYRQMGKSRMMKEIFKYEEGIREEEEEEEMEKIKKINRSGI